MLDADEVLASMCGRYADAVNANDSEAHSKLFTQDAIRIGEDWIYGIAHVDATTAAHADGATSSFRATKTWLLHRQPAGEWLIVRQMWNLKP